MTDLKGGGYPIALRRQGSQVRSEERSDGRRTNEVSAPRRGEGRRPESILSGAPFSRFYGAYVTVCWLVAGGPRGCKSRTSHIESGLVPAILRHFGGLLAITNCQGPVVLSLLGKTNDLCRIFRALVPAYEHADHLRTVPEEPLAC